MQPKPSEPLEPIPHLYLALQALERYQIGYLLIDRELIVLAGNDLIHCWITRDLPALVGQPTTELFPELVGAETHLHNLFQDGQVFTLRQIHRPAAEPFGVYFDLRIEPAKNMDNLLLLTVLDVTTQTRHQQRIQQQRNEKQLLAAQLNAVTEQLAYLLKRFVPEPVAQELIASNRIPELGSEMEREATVLFADMRGFTGLAEHLPPDAVLDLLNEYLGVVAEAVLRHNGTLVQVVGDMVMGVFNLPVLQPDHAQRALEAGLDIQQSLRQHHVQRKASDSAQLPVGFGIGISTGRVVAGFLGMKQRYRYAVVGDTTNVAFYLCSQATSGQVILCESTLNALTNTLADANGRLSPNISFVPIGDVWPKRRSQPVRIFGLTGTLT